MEILATFAEIGFTLAGFTGVVVVLGRRAAGEWMPLDRLRIHIMLEIAALVVAFSLLPYIVSPLGLSDLARYRLCGLLFAFAHAISVGAILLRRRALVTAGDPSPFIDTARLAIGVAIIGCQIAVSAFGALATIEFVYLAALTWVLAMGGLDFAFVLLRPIRDAA